MIYKLFCTVIFSTYLLANSFSINDNINSFSLPDQFDKIHTINEQTQTIIVSFEKGTGKMVSEFLSKKAPDFLQNHQAVFIADISQMPSFVTKLFALPKMRGYKHKILLIYKENDERFIQKEEMSTVYQLQKGEIKSIEYITTKDELAKVFK